MNLEHIRRLNLKGNKLFNISFEAFQNLPELEDLDMSYNKLTTFDFNMFDQVGTLSIFRVNVSHNSLKELQVNVPMAFASGAGKFYIERYNNVKIVESKSVSCNSIGF